MTAAHCARVKRVSGGRKATSNTSAANAMRTPAVPAAPSAGNSPFASAAPPWTLTMEKRTAGRGGRLQPERPTGASCMAADPTRSSPTPQATRRRCSWLDGLQRRRPLRDGQVALALVLGLSLPEARRLPGELYPTSPVDLLLVPVGGARRRRLVPEGLVGQAIGDGWTT